MIIERSVSASDTPAFALIAEGWCELVQDGFTPEGDGVCPIMPSDHVLYAIGDEPDDVIGVVVYSAVPLGGKTLITVEFAYVEASSRRRGVFKAMLAALPGVVDLSFAAPAENAPFRAVLAQLGLKTRDAG